MNRPGRTKARVRRAQHEAKRGAGFCSLIPLTPAERFAPAFSHLVEPARIMLLGKLYRCVNLHDDVLAANQPQEMGALRARNSPPNQFQPENLLLSPALFFQPLIPVVPISHVFPIFRRAVIAC